MIGRLRGDLIDLSGSFALVEAGGVGYEVQVPDLVAHLLPPLGMEVTLYIRQIFREDGVFLYGFSEIAQRRIFDLLLSVKGCGPKVALALIGQLGDEAVASAILSQDAKTLARAQGVGVKLAERINLELKDKMAEENLTRKLVLTHPNGRKGPTDELVETLLSLGCRRQEAEAAAESAREAEVGLEMQIKHALRLLQKSGVIG